MCAFFSFTKGGIKLATLSYYAGQLRKMAERQIARLEREAKKSTTSAREKRWIRQREKELKSASQGTRVYNPKTGKKYKSKTESYIASQVTRLAKAIARVPRLYEAKRDSFIVTQQELNLASVKAPSVYTQTEAKLFYRVTQQIWEPEERKWKKEHEHQKVEAEFNRNDAIVEYYNAKRAENGLSPLQLEEIVEAILEKNEKAHKVAATKGTDFEPDDEEAKAFYEAMQVDNADGEAGSPPGIGQAITNEIRNALEGLFVVPDPEDI